MSQETAIPSTAATVAFVSLGCPKNTVDSETMLGTLIECGYQLVEEDDRPDAIVINTCGFLEASKQESLEVIAEAVQRKKRGEIDRVIVAGCLVQRHRAKLLEWAPGIDAMIGVFDRDHITDAVTGPGADRTQGPDEGSPRYWIAGNALQAANDRGLETIGLTVHGKDGRGIGYYEGDHHRLRITPRHWAYLRMSEGCNQKCAFCTIPSIRGKMRSKPVDEIVSEAEALMADGAFELNLIGQDTTNFGRDIGYDGAGEGLIGLLTALDGAAGVNGGAWIRLMYAYPSTFTDAMIDTIAKLPNINKYIDIPLQHASESMLTAMRRQTSAAHQTSLLHKLRDRIPGIAIRTTFITGFPGETQDDHDQLLAFLEEMRFEAMGVFQYSREPGTPAGTMDLDESLHVPDELKAQREEELMLLQQRIAFEDAAAIASERRPMAILLDGPTGEVIDDLHVHTGRHQGQAPQVDAHTIVLANGPLIEGDLAHCTIIDSDGYDLIARPTEDLDTSIRLPIFSS
jgi:ribosomal protein S12 methylthiotransferase